MRYRAGRVSVKPAARRMRMAKTVKIGNGPRHLVVSTDKYLSPLCGATQIGVANTESRRRAASGDVTCKNCKKVFKTAVQNLLA
jgi:transcription elongation factor Elf1